MRKRRRLTDKRDINRLMASKSHKINESYRLLATNKMHYSISQRVSSGKRVCEKTWLSSDTLSGTEGVQTKRNCTSSGYICALFLFSS
jgi:hypothetical protein